MLSWISMHLAETGALGLLALMAYFVWTLVDKATLIIYHLQQMITRLETIEFTLEMIDQRAARVHPDPELLGPRS